MRAVITKILLSVSTYDTCGPSCTMTFLKEGLTSEVDLHDLEAINGGRLVNKVALKEHFHKFILI
jgi:ABC-type sulfate transport system substrate-binding protein